MTTLEETEANHIQSENKPTSLKLKILAILASVAGVAVFAYYIYSVGPMIVLEGVSGIGLGGFAIIVGIYALKLLVRAVAWKLSVYEPYEIGVRDTFAAVVIGEAASSVIPMGVLISGTAKAIAVRKRVPLVVGLASVATENLFYSLVTGLFIIFGAALFLRRYGLEAPFDLFLDGFIILVILGLSIGALMVIRQWHWASEIADRLYSHGYFPRILRNGRLHVRMFENLIYGFYRAHPKRFVPLCLLQIAFHACGIAEVWFVLVRIGERMPSLIAPFYLESMSRLVTVVFKLVPFLIGVDEAGAEFVVEALGLAAGVGVTLAIIRKGRVIFWALIGLILIVKRGLTLTHVREISGRELELQ
ncbi:MAG: lysylphosphatidylglycerol synthase transmembrane domain-containing protein [Pyrinomonadaceae bacterium]